MTHCPTFEARPSVPSEKVFDKVEKLIGVADPKISEFLPSQTFVTSREVSCKLEDLLAALLRVLYLEERFEILEIRFI